MTKQENDHYHHLSPLLFLSSNPPFSPSPVEREKGFSYVQEIPLGWRECNGLRSSGWKNHRRLRREDV